MGVVTAQILILVLGVVLTLGGWVLIRRAMEAFSSADNALPLQALFAAVLQSLLNLAPALLVQGTAPSRAPPALFLRRRRKVPVAF